MDLVISYSGLRNASWASISNEVVITDNADELKKLKTGDTLWLLSLHTQWLEFLQAAIEKGCKVILMYNVPSKPDMEQALANGALAYCPAAMDNNTISAVKNAVENDYLWVPAKYLSSLTSAVASFRDSRDINYDIFLGMDLSAKEQSVVKLILQGKTNAEIAKELYVSERTVKEHLTKIFKKLNVKDRLQLALLVLKH
jgi:DNA-binding NarL/FixJ family response regulator